MMNSADEEAGSERQFFRRGETGSPVTRSGRAGKIEVSWKAPGQTGPEQRMRES
jgi:hypothetical protein